MGAGPHKIQIAITSMPVPWPKITHLHQVMAQAMIGAFDQVKSLLPILGRVSHLEFDMLVQVGDAEPGQSLQHNPPCSSLESPPILRDGLV